MKKLFALALTAAFFLSLSGAAHASVTARAELPSQQNAQMQSVGFSFFSDDVDTSGAGKKRDGGKNRPVPTPRPRKPGPRDEGDGD